jgi:dienelactone hydrolase
LVLPWFATVQTHGQLAGGHWLKEIRALPDHSISLDLGGSMPAAFRSYFDLYMLEASDDLADWTPLASLLRTNALTTPRIYLDTGAGKLPQRFYRLLPDSRPTPFRQPTGPFPVGTLVRQLSDPSRTNRYNIKTNSSFMATFWYPARSLPSQLPALYQDPKLALYLPYWGGFLTNVVPHFVVHAVPDAPITAGGEQYPIIIYSHGLADGISEGGTGGGVRGENAATAVELASYGFVVVAIDHIDCYASVFPDQTMVLRASPLDNVLSHAGPYLTSRFQDLGFVLRELSQLAQTDPIFANRLDLGRVGIMGWSFGGGTAAEFCRTNDQVQAAVLLDGYLDPVPVVSKALEKPFLAMNSPNSGLAPSAMDLFNKATNTAYVLQIRGTEHETFTDQAWITEHADVTRLAGQAKNACAVSFFNKIFKNQDDHLLDAPANKYANVTAFYKKP